MKRTFFSLALLLAVATLTAQTKMTAREAAVKIADRILASLHTSSRIRRLVRYISPSRSYLLIWM